MYVSIPETFCVPVNYVEADTLNIKSLSILEECYEYNDFTNKATKRNSIIIGVILPTQRESRWAKDRNAMEKRAGFKGATIKVEYNDFDVVKHISLIEKLISEGINVLIFVPLNQEGEEEVIERAKKAGVKVICYDLLARNSYVDLFVGFNSLRIGEFQGRYLVRRFPKGNYIILTGDPGGDLLKEGAMEYIKPLVLNRDIIIVTDGVVKGWDPKSAFEIVKQSLIAHNNRIDAILAPNDAIAGAAIEALQAQGLARKVVVTGRDADEAAVRRLLEGTQAMTVFNDAAKLGETAIDVAIKLINGEYIDYYYVFNNEKVDVHSILIEPIELDKTNVYSVLQGSLV